MLLEDVVSIKQHNLKKLITAVRFNDQLTKKDISKRDLSEHCYDHQPLQ